MATYTTLVSTICTQQWMNENPGQPLPKFKNLIMDVADIIIPVELPVDAPFTGTQVAYSILRHYWMREIGLETVSFWQYAMIARLEEILPKYIEIAKAQLEMGSIFETDSRQETWDVERSGQKEYKEDISNSSDSTLEQKENSITSSTGETGETITGENKENSSSTGKLTGESNTTNNASTETTDTGSESGKTTVTANGQKLFSDTPQNGLNAVVAGNYLTNATVDNSTSATNTESDNSNSGSIHTTETSSGTKEDNSTDSSEISATNSSERKGTSKDSGEMQRTGSYDSSTEGDQKKTGSGKDSGEEKGNRKHSGYYGDKAKTLYNYQQLYVSVFQLIIGEVADLFISIL